MHRWMASAAGGTSQRLNLGEAMVLSRASSPFEFETAAAIGISPGCCQLGVFVRLPSQMLEGPVVHTTGPSCSALLLEARGLFGAARGIAIGVGMGSCTGELAALGDEVFLTDGPPLEPAFEYLARPGGVTRLRRERGARDVRGHAMVR